MSKATNLTTQITLSNSIERLEKSKDSLAAWLEAYFALEVTTSASTQREQRRDIQTFISFLIAETGSDHPDGWTSRLSADFRTTLRTMFNDKGARRWNDRTINRMLAHLKTFARWVNKHRIFPLGDPMEKLKSFSVASLLNVDRAITSQERRRILDAADLLIKIGGASKDRKRYASETDRPKRRGYRAYRNRAIIYTLIETGMRRAAITSLNLESVNEKNRTILAEEKGGSPHEYSISKEGLKAIQDYVEAERNLDQPHYEQSSALFLPSNTTKSNNQSGRLHPNAINEIWNEICKTAGVDSKTPHSARHAMGRHIIAKTGNIAAVQRQLGHKNAAYSMQYSRITRDELDEVINDR